MKYVRTYESFKNREKNSSLSQYQDDEVVNEEIIGMLGNLLKTATGAFKNFINGLMAPFKTLKDEVKKTTNLEDVKKKFITAIDTIGKNSINSINKSKDEAELNKMWDTFLQQIDDKMAEFDKEIKTVKESKIFEGALQDALIRTRVFFGMLKTQFNNAKQKFDQKVAAAKELNGKKQARIEQIKVVINDFKKKINDQKLVDQATEQYKEENKISEGGGKIILDWGDVEMELKRIKTSAQGGVGIYNYQVVKSNSEKLKVKDDDEVLVIIKGMAEIGKKVKLTEIYRNGKEDPLREYETGNLEKIIVDGEEKDKLELGKDTGDDDDKEFTNTLGELKKKDPESIEKLKKISALYKDKDDPKNKEKIQKIQKELQGKEGQSGQ